MAGRKFGAVVAVKVAGSYFALGEEERQAPGKVMAELAARYAGKVDILRRLWTRAFTAEVTDVFYVECDDLMDLHNWTQETNELMARGGMDPDQYGATIALWVGVNPDAG